MLTEFKIPGLGENISSGLVSKIMVKVGDVVKKDQAVIELESDKATLEIPISFGGVVKEILIKEGTQIKVGQTVFKIDTETTSGVFIPVSPETKTNVVNEKPLTKQSPHVISSAQDSTIIAQEIKSNIPPPPTSPKVEQPTQVAKEVAAAPSVRKFAREIGIDITQVPGTGPKGRISLEDVKAYSKQLNSGAIARPASGGVIGAVALPDFSKWGEVERKPMNMIRQKTAQHLSSAWATIPHVTQFDKADITELDNLRKRCSKKVEEKGGKLTITPFIVKVIASALKTFPQFNASVDMSKNEIVFKKYYHIGIAVDTERGLLVPVIRDADKKSIIEIAVELTQMGERARAKKTIIEEMQGGTFSITNLGGIGGTFFTPIVNSPEVAILGISRAAFEPIYSNNTFVPKLMLPLSLSYDHRLIDGADGARFLRWVVEAIQQPFFMELEG